MQKIQNINYHHDAITGTHFPAVGVWYDQYMLNAIEQANYLIDQIFSKEAANQGLLVDGFKGCYLHIWMAHEQHVQNTRQRCGIINEKRYLVGVYNPSLFRRDTILLRTDSTAASVKILRDG